MKAGDIENERESLKNCAKSGCWVPGGAARQSFFAHQGLLLVLLIPPVKRAIVYNGDFAAVVHICIVNMLDCIALDCCVGCSLQPMANIQRASRLTANKLKLLLHWVVSVSAAAHCVIMSHIIIQQSLLSRTTTSWHSGI
jgi:hypothetical protein